LDMAYHSSVGCDRRGDQPTGYATPSACFHTPEITITHTFEDSLVLSNVQRFTGKPRRGLMRAFSEAIQNADTVQALGVALFEKLRTGDKAEFALEVLGDPDFGQLVVPAYIHEGLTWLQSKLELKRKDLLVVPPAIVEVTEE
ncbi:hypothetical protein ACRCO4_29580, partial [Pseudomonas aeruginosa]